jgi:hypothetical protein
MMIGEWISECNFFGSAGNLPAVAGASCPRRWRRGAATTAAGTAALLFRGLSEWQMF